VAKKKNRKHKKKIQRQKRTNSAKEVFPLGRYFVYLLIAGALLVGVLTGLKYFFIKNSFFNIEEIYINKDKGYSFSDGRETLERLYFGKNIFSINLKQTEILLKKEYPALKKVEVKRRLPSILEVDIVSRIPVAVIDYAGGIIVDSEGMVLNIGEEPEHLIVIKGISFFLNMPSRGEEINSESLQNSLSLIEDLSQLGAFKRQVEYIDISDKNNIILEISNVPIKMGNDQFYEKTVSLRAILTDPNISLDEIKYIDLRFKDAVIAPK